MNTAPVGVTPLQKPPTAKKKYTPAMVLMKRLVCTPFTLFTNPLYSHIVRPVTKAKSTSIAIGFIKLITMAATKNMPVMLLTMRFFILLGFIVFSEVKEFTEVIEVKAITFYCLKGIHIWL